jgi:hypothetical protein
VSLIVVPVALNRWRRRPSKNESFDCCSPSDSFNVRPMELVRLTSFFYFIFFFSFLLFFNQSSLTKRKHNVFFLSEPTTSQQPNAGLALKHFHVCLCETVRCPEKSVGTCAIGRIGNLSLSIKIGTRPLNDASAVPVSRPNSN